MQVDCLATVEDATQRDNLCVCIRILGGVPIVKGDDVRLSYEGDPSLANKFVKLFENYITREIQVQA